LTSPIAGSVLPIKRAEELILTLPGVISARIIAGDSGAIDQIHVLTTSELTPKQMVRNIEMMLSEGDLNAGADASSAAANGLLFLFCMVALLFTGAVLMLKASA